MHGKTLTISVMGLATAAALTLGSTDARAQSGAYAPPPPGFEPQVAPQPMPPQGYYVPPSVAASGPRVIKDWEEGEPVPPGYHPVRRVRTGLIVGGAVTFGVVYLINVMVAAIYQDTDKAFGGTGSRLTPLYAPIVGPFIQMGSTSSATGNVFLVLDGLAQAGGLAMLIAGIAAPKTVLVRNDLGKNNKLELLPMPMTFGSNSAGFGFVGKF
jgi:hypothetical protein